jgi:predicted RNA-binding protein with PIN domain
MERAFEDPTERKLPGIEAPTLVLRTESDKMAPESWAERIADAIPDSELQIIPAAPRVSAASAAPALAKLVTDFIGREPHRREDPPEDRDTRRLIVDGMNVVGSRPDGWWRDRPRAWRELRRDLEEYARNNDADVLLVLDGKRPAGWREDDLVETAFAPGGRDSADDAIVARVKADPDPDSLCVVTSDRDLAARVEELGAGTRGASVFRAELD